VTTSSPDDDLRRQVRARLSDNRLPRIDDGASKSHRGTGRPCIVCRRAIEPPEVERELDGVGVILIAHEACYVLWHEESVRGAQSGDPSESPKASQTRRRPIGQSPTQGL
jgi:hypothetical protein